MKNNRRIVSLLLALTLTLALGVTSMASAYQITLQGTAAGQKFNAVKIFDMTYATAGATDPVAYTIADGWEPFFTRGATGAKYIVTPEQAAAATPPIDTTTLTPITVKKSVVTGNAADTGNVEAYINITDANANEFSTTAKDWAVLNLASIPAANKVIDEPAAPTGTSTVIDVGTAGYWMLYENSGTFSTPKSGYQTTVTLTSAKPTATAQMKADKSTATKSQADFEEFATNGTEIGKVLPYKVESKVASADGHKVHFQKFYDYMTPGLTFDKNVKVFLVNPVNGTETEITNDINVVTSQTQLNAKTNYGKYGGLLYIDQDASDIAADTNKADNGFKLNLNTKALNDDGYLGYDIRIEYSSTVNSNAAVRLGDENQLLYGNGGGDGDEWEPEPGITPDPIAKVHTWVHKVSVDKYVGDSEKISNANTPTYNVNTAATPATATAAAATLNAGQEIDLTGRSATDAAGDTYVEITYNDGTSNVTTWIKADAYENEKLPNVGFLLVRKSVEGLKVKTGQTVELLDDNLTTATKLADLPADTFVKLVGTGTSTEYPGGTKTEYDWYKVVYNNGTSDVTGYILKDDSKLDAATEALASEEFYVQNSTTKAVTWTTDPTQATEVFTNANGVAEFPGLEDGTYYLREKTTPAGYNSLANDVSVTVSHNDTTVSGSVVPKGVAHVESVANNTGATLPETGGFGSMLFYIFGIAMLFGAGLFLFVGRRTRIAIEKE